MKTRLEISAGGVIYRPQRGAAEVCLIATQGGKAWQLPKGLIERGERPEDAARREVAEETGLRGELLRRLDRIEYWYVWEEDGERTRVHKFVYFFLFRCTGGSTDDHDHEVDEARWFRLAEAQQRLSFENERRVLRLAAEPIEAGAGEGD
jgi:8-oxo-dGTP pyrophosphatase MutT (NUDIX family)